MSSLKWLKEMKKTEEEINQKLGFLSGFKAAFKDQIHTDILIKPGNDAPSIPAHRALLVLLDLFLSFSYLIVIECIYRLMINDTILFVVKYQNITF